MQTPDALRASIGQIPRERHRGKRLCSPVPSPGTPPILDLLQRDRRLDREKEPENRQRRASGSLRRPPSPQCRRCHDRRRAHAVVDETRHQFHFTNGPNACGLLTAVPDV